jgi:hypothetical protein
MASGAMITSGVQGGSGPGSLGLEASGDVVIEVAVRRADADDTAARLRADGHRILGMRPAEGAERAR